MNYVLHSESSVRKFGGCVNDYVEIHKFIDSAKYHNPLPTHRLVLHNTFGMQLAVQLFGDWIINSAGKKVCVREIVEQHLIEDMGKILTLEQCLRDVRIQDWMGPPTKKEPGIRLSTEE